MPKKNAATTRVKGILRDVIAGSLFIGVFFSVNAKPELLFAQAAPPAADYDVLPAEWMGLADDLLFPCVKVGSASLPLVFAGRDPSRPAAQVVTFAALPADLLAIGRREGVGLSGAPSALRFVMSAATDQQGNKWFGCEDWGQDSGEEDSGVFCYMPSTKKWLKFTTKDGLGDDYGYALAVDKLGRIWVGHLNHGVSVYNGRSWQNYEVVAGLSKRNSLAGPLGERIFDIAVAPAGDVWIASSAGLARYSGGGVAPASTSSSQPATEGGRWTYFTRAEGLPSDQAQCLAFAADGTLYVGTQCDGIAIGSPVDNYATWRVVRGPDKKPTEAHGDGLPANLINDVLVSRSGNIYAATTLGLAESKDKGQTWHYWRGRDYAAKVKGLYGGPPQGWQEQPGCWLAEDYVTCLAEDARGLLMGYRTRGYELVKPDSGERLAAGANPNDFVTAILPQPDGVTLVGTYGEGMRISGLARPGVAVMTSAFQSAMGGSQARVGFPASAQAPSSGELIALTERLQSIPAARVSDEPLVVALADDWTTRGDWLGRYGKYWVCTTAMDYNYIWGAGAQPVGYHCQIGPHAEKGDSLRYWISVLSTSEQRSMEMPPVYMHRRVLRGEATWDKYRRQAEHGDHGESLPLSHEGPNIYYSVTVPPGLYVLSFYNTNKDGHTADNRLRDYRFSVRPFAGVADKLILTNSVEAQTGRYSRSQYVDLDGFADRPELASARQRDFWGGTYKRFLVRGPSALTIEMARNGSVNTINAGIFLDEALAEQPDPYFPGIEGGLPASSNGPSSKSKSSDVLLAELSALAQRNPAEWAIHHPLYAQLLRACLADPQAGQSASAAATCYFQSHRFAPWEAVQKDQGLTTAREIEKALRWDQTTDACTGKGRQFVQAYVAAIAKPATRPTSAVEREVAVRSSDEK